MAPGVGILRAKGHWTGALLLSLAKVHSLFTGSIYDSLFTSSILFFTEHDRPTGEVRQRFINDDNETSNRLTALTPKFACCDFLFDDLSRPLPRYREAIG